MTRDGCRLGLCPLICGMATPFRLDLRTNMQLRCRIFHGQFDLKHRPPHQIRGHSPKWLAADGKAQPFRTSVGTARRRPHTLSAAIRIFGTPSRPIQNPADERGTSLDVTGLSSRLGRSICCEAMPHRGANLQCMRPSRRRRCGGGAPVER